MSKHDPRACLACRQTESQKAILADGDQPAPRSLMSVSADRFQHDDGEVALRLHVFWAARWQETARQTLHSDLDALIDGHLDAHETTGDEEQEVA